MAYTSMSVSERQLLPPAVAVSTVAFALHPPAHARLGESGVEAAYAAAAAVGFAGAVSDAGAAAEVPAETSARARDTLWLPLVRRTRAPFAGDWALPGGPIPFNETLADTAVRTLRAAVLRDPRYLEQLYSFGAVERSAQAQRLVTIAYWALYGEQDLAGDALTGAAEQNIDEQNIDEQGAAEQDDPNVAWFSADRLPPLAFDHAEIVAHALDRLRSKTEYSTVAYRFLGDTFTLAQLREVHEAVRGEAVDPANFRRQALAQGHLVDTGEQTSGAKHRPARLYQFREQTTQQTRNLT